MSLVRKIVLVFSIFFCTLTPAKAGRFEAGSFTAHDTAVNSAPVRINFQQTFDTIPVVIALTGIDGPDAATIRITNISTTGFDELSIEPDSFDGAHGSETIHYLAVEPGRHVLPDGRIVEAGRSTISDVQRGSGVSGAESWASIAFSSALPSTPAIVMQLQTANSETRTVASQTSQPFLTATMQNASSSGFQLALERSEASAGPTPSAETIGWAAFPAGVSGTFLDIANASVTWSGVNTAANVRGYDNGCFTNAFGLTSATAIVVAKKSTHFGGDGGWIRRCSLSSTTIGLTVDEDTSRDTERAHISEEASIIAFSRSFHAKLEPVISVTKVSTGFTGPLPGGFALPGATAEYLITVQNSGNAPPNYDSVIITEALPSQLALVVTDFAAPGSGPVIFQDGSPTSGLTCNFISLASTADCYSFSTDGATFNYTPVDSGDGTDPAVTHIRARPTGYMRSNTGSGDPSLTLRLKGTIK